MGSRPVDVSIVEKGCARGKRNKEERPNVVPGGHGKETGVQGEGPKTRGEINALNGKGNALEREERGLIGGEEFLSGHRHFSDNEKTPGNSGTHDLGGEFSLYFNPKMNDNGGHENRRTAKKKKKDRRKREMARRWKEPAVRKEEG